MEDYKEYVELQSNMFQYYNDINTSHTNISYNDISINKANDDNVNDTNISYNDISNDITNDDNVNDVSTSSCNTNDTSTNASINEDHNITISYDQTQDDNISYDKNNDDDIIDTSMLKPICENDLDFTNCVKTNEHNDINTSVYYYKDYK